MVYPKIGSTVGTVVAPQSTQASTGQTTAFAVIAGDSVYVLIGYDSGGSGTTHVSSVTDSQTPSSNVYRQAGISKNPALSGQTNPTIEIWSADNVKANSGLKVTVNFSANTLFAVVAAEVSGAVPLGSLDVVSAGAQPGTYAVPVTTSSDPIAPVSPTDLILAVQCTVRPTGSMTASSGFTAAFTALASGSADTYASPYPQNDVILNGFYDSPVAAGNYNSNLTWASTSWGAGLTVAIRAPIPWSGFDGTPSVTVSPIGITGGGSLTINGGADFGPDTPGTATVGIQEAINSLAAAGGGTITLLPGTYAPTTYITLTVSNVSLQVDPAAIIQLPANPGWSLLTGPGISRSPIIILSGVSNVTVSGGQWQMVTPTTFYAGTGIHVGQGCARVLIRDCTFSSFTRFAVLVTGYDNTSGTGVGNPTSDITVEGCKMISCGNTNTPDGGGIRFGNSSGLPASGFKAIRNTMTTMVMFGIDVNNPGSNSYKMSDIVIAFNDISFVTTSGTPQTIGIYLEKSASGTVVNTVGALLDQNHVFGGFNCLAIQGGVQQVIVLGGLYEASWRAPVLLSAPNTSTLSDITLSGLIAKNGNKGGGTTGHGGIEIATTTATDSGTIQNIQIVDCRCLDDQGAGSQTQNYGLNFYNDGSTGSPNLIIGGGILVSGGLFSGNKVGDVNVDVIAGPFTPPVFHVPVPGSDNRPAVTAPDTSPLTLWTPLSNAVYELTLYLNATTWTSGTATYTIKYKLTDGSPQTLSGSTNAIDQNVAVGPLVVYVQGGSAITGQLTGTFVGKVTIAVTLSQRG